MKLNIEGIDYSQTLGPWIAGTYKMMDAYMEGVLCENKIPLTKQQWIALNYVKMHPGISQNELAKFLNRDKTSVTRFVATLEKKGFMTKETSEEDKRFKVLKVTEIGLDIIKSATPILREAILRLQREVSKEDIQKTISSLQKIQEKIKQIK